MRPQDPSDNPLRTDHDVIILGAGLGGLGMGRCLKAAAIQNFVILEKSHAVGGTWRDNTYPGAACDTESHLYCYDFELHIGVSRLYARQPELLRYATRLAERAGLAPHIRYGTEVVAAGWSDAAHCWRLTLADGSTLTSRVFIPAWGQLNRPSIPNFPGRDDFAGRAFHSANWPTDFTGAGLRVASIGNAASAIQYIPEIAPIVAHLTVFQRSPNWIVPRGDRPYSPDELRQFSDPEAFKSDRQRLFTWRETTFLRMRAGSDDAAEIETLARAHVAAQVPDAALRAQLIPDFPLGCKRVLRSDEYFPALTRDNVSLETEAIARIHPRAIETTTGRRHEVDVIIYGTGFETQSFQGTVDVRGAGGTELRKRWAAGAEAYLGMTVADFPNLFLIYGPNTNLGHNSVLSMLEAQFGYVVGALNYIFADTQRAIDVRPEIMSTFNATLQQEMVGSAWAGDCTSWYKNAAGKVVNNWSGPVAEYERLTASFDAADFVERTRHRGMA